MPATEKDRIIISLNQDLTGFGSAGSVTPAHRRVLKHYASPLLGGPLPSEDLLELVTHIYTEDEAETLGKSSGEPADPTAQIQHHFLPSECDARGCQVAFGEDAAPLPELLEVLVIVGAIR